MDKQERRIKRLQGQLGRDNGPRIVGTVRVLNEHGATPRRTITILKHWHGGLGEAVCREKGCFRSRW